MNGGKNKDLDPGLGSNADILTLLVGNFHYLCDGNK